MNRLWPALLLLAVALGAMGCNARAAVPTPAPTAGPIADASTPTSTPGVSSSPTSRPVPAAKVTSIAAAVATNPPPSARSVAATATSVAATATSIPATPTIPPSPTVPPCAEPGRIEHGVLDSAVAGEPMRYRIYLPPCYDVDGRLYPTLYMFGGNVHDDAIWDVLGLDEAAEQLIANGDISPLLIVMPDNGWLANTTTSGPNSYEGFILNELIPHIEATYRAQPAREGRAVGGLSRGGYWSLMMAFRRPDLFRSVGAHSPALIDSHAGPAENPAITGTVNDLGDLRIWVDIGERDPYLSKALPLHEALTAAGVAHEWRVEPGTHDEAYWRARLGQYLLWYDGGATQ